jgi:GNAT superfamily N-acetyltransferase
LQYTHLSPQTCFVLDDGTGRAVGYVIGCPDVFAFASSYQSYITSVLQSPRGLEDVPPPEQLETLEPWSTVSERGEKSANPRCMAQTAYNPKWLLLEGVEGKRELVEAYRATMHIDLLEEWQGKGWGRKMIERFVESVGHAREAGEGKVDFGRGIHIGVSGENTKVVPFYKRVRFQVYKGGEREGNVWMTRGV